MQYRLAYNISLIKNGQALNPARPGQAH